MKYRYKLLSMTVACAILTLVAKELFESHRIGFGAMMTFMIVGAVVIGALHAVFIQDIN